MQRQERDCTTGEETMVDLSPAEEAAITAAQDAATERLTARDAADQALREAVAAHPDPVVQALGKRLGLC